MSSVAITPVGSAEAAQIGGVAADLVGTVRVQADEFEVGALDDRRAVRALPTLPVENWMIRRVTAASSEQIGDGLQAGLVEHAGQHAAVDLDGGAVDEIGCARREEHAGAADLGGLAAALERYARRSTSPRSDRPWAARTSGSSR